MARRMDEGAVGGRAKTMYMNFRQLFFYTAFSNLIGGGTTAAFDGRYGKAAFFGILALISLVGMLWPEGR